MVEGSAVKNFTMGLATTGLGVGAATFGGAAGGARNSLTQNSDKLKTIFRDYPNGTVTIEGHADERGSAEYNLGLGDRRAIAAREFLVQLGVSADRLRTLSYGKERPQCTDNSETCWQKNRRAHFTGQ